MKEKFNLQIYLIYGTLLGAIREKDFIPHDTDIDIAYLSHYNTEYEVKQERIKLIQNLDKLQMLRKLNTRGIKIKFGNSGFDLWTSYVSNNRYFLHPRGRICSQNIFLPLKELEFRKEMFLVPNKPEELLDKFYITWQKPILKDRHYNK